MTASPPLPTGDVRKNPHPDICPECHAAGLMESDAAGEVFCGNCRRVLLRRDFRPPPPDDRPEEALPDMAVCAHHPAKRAVAVCAGTGDFICSLCRVDHNGKIYSLQYLDGGGRELPDLAFERYLDRPDRSAFGYLCASLLFCPFLLPAVYYGVRASRLARRDGLFADLAGRTRIAVAHYAPIVALAACIMMLIATISAIA